MPAHRALAIDDDAPVLSEVLRFMLLLWALVDATEKVSKRMKHDMGVTDADRAATRRVLARLTSRLDGMRARERRAS